MFYSHQLLARKAPLGQIWMAATMHAKIHRRKLDKLNIISICEEILNPSVPMALRLSGILMGGVVIVYERKVKLLYEDVTRFLVEINEAWKVKTVRDPTILPKGRSHAKYADITLPDNEPTDLGDIEQPLQFSNSETQRGFQRSAYTEMKLDSINEAYTSHNLGKQDIPHDHHQANIDDITMCDKFDSHQTEPAPFDPFERFDIDGDEETQANSSFHDHTDIPSTLIPSPPPQNEPQFQNPDEIHEQHPGDFPNQQVSDEDKEKYNSPKRQKPNRRIAKRFKATLMDYGQTIIPGQMYQSWLQNASDIVSKRGHKRKINRNTVSTKIARLMDLPPVSLVCGLVGEKDIHYPLPILKLWTKSIQPLHDSPSAERNNSPPHPPAPSSSSPLERNNYHDPISPPFEDQHIGEVGSGSLGVSVENIRVNIMDNNEVDPSSIPFEKSTTEVNMRTFTPSNSGDDVRSIPSGELLPRGSDVNSGRSNKKRPFSSSRRSGSNLEPVIEELHGHSPDPVFKLSELSENENDLVVETGHTPTQTQKVPIPEQPAEQLTESIRMQLKTHFDTPGSAKTESLDQLAFGLSRKAAAGLFYQTCVLATRGFVKVEQKVAYGDILLSRGAKM